jgi:hypothetical protein
MTDLHPDVRDIGKAVVIAFASTLATALVNWGVEWAKDQMKRTRSDKSAR